MPKSYSAIHRQKDGKFKPGHSIRQGSKGWEAKAVEECYRALDHGIARLIELMDCSDDRIALKAIGMVMDRALGKSVARSDVTVKHSLGAEHLQALKELARAEPPPQPGDTAKLIDASPASSQTIEGADAQKQRFVERQKGETG